MEAFSSKPLADFQMLSGTRNEVLSMINRICDNMFQYQHAYSCNAAHESCKKWQHQIFWHFWEHAGKFHSNILFLQAIYVSLIINQIFSMVKTEEETLNWVCLKFHWKSMLDRSQSKGSHSYPLCFSSGGSMKTIKSKWGTSPVYYDFSNWNGISTKTHIGNTLKTEKFIKNKNFRSRWAWWILYLKIKLTLNI